MTDNTHKWGERDSEMLTRTLMKGRMNLIVNPAPRPRDPKTDSATPAASNFSDFISIGSSNPSYMAPYDTDPGKVATFSSTLQ